MVVYPMMINIHSKHEYFSVQLQIEREQLDKFKNELIEQKSCYSNNIRKDDMTCQKCWWPVLDLNFNHIINHVLKNNKHIKRSYDDTLFPLQRLLIPICLFNTLCITIIFKEPIKLFLTSNLVTIICLCIYRELFIEDKPNVYYTLITGVGILLFSVFLLIKILLTLLNIIYYHILKNILTTE